MNTTAPVRGTVGTCGSTPSDLDDAGPLRRCARDQVVMHRVCAQISTPIHRPPVGNDIVPTATTTVDHTVVSPVCTREIAGLSHRAAVDGRVQDGPRLPGWCTQLCMSLWITVDDGPIGVDGPLLLGGQRVGKIRLPTGRATYPHCAHGPVHTQK